MAQLSAWQDYAAHKLYLQQISIPWTVRNNICILPGKTGVVSLTLRPNKTSFTPRHTIIGKGIAYVKPLDPNLPLRPIEIEFENNLLYRNLQYFRLYSKILTRTRNGISMPGLRA